MLIGVRYIGRKAFPRPDNLFGTGTVWETPESVVMLPDAIAHKFLAFRDVYVRDGEVTDEVADAIGLPRATEAVEPAIVEDNLPPLAQLDAMDKEALLTYAQRHFNTQPKGNVYQVRSAIRILMNDVRHQ